MWFCSVERKVVQYTYIKIKCVKLKTVYIAMPAVSKITVFVVYARNKIESCCCVLFEILHIFTPFEKWMLPLVMWMLPWKQMISHWITFCDTPFFKILDIFTAFPYYSSTKLLLDSLYSAFPCMMILNFLFQRWHGGKMQIFMRSWTIIIFTAFTENGFDIF